MYQALILNIETSTNVCSAALAKGTDCIFSKADFDGMNHAALLSVFIEEAFEILKSRAEKLDAVAVSSGPGSYTGLRIGASTAKGICYGLDIPLIAVDTLKILAFPAFKTAENQSPALLCPMIDARRMEVYDAFYKADGTVFRETAADIITEDSFADILENNTVYFFGSGSDKCKPVITHKNAHFIDGFVPLAENMTELAFRAYNKKEFADTAYFEPFYLKEFQTTTAKNKIEN